MKVALKAFHQEVRLWNAEMPIGTTIYVAAEVVNWALMLMDAQLNAVIDERVYERRYGEGGIE